MDDRLLVITWDKDTYDSRDDSNITSMGHSIDTQICIDGFWSSNIVRKDVMPIMVDRNI